MWGKNNKTHVLNNKTHVLNMHDKLQQFLVSQHLFYSDAFPLFCTLILYWIFMTIYNSVPTECDAIIL